MWKFSNLSSGYTLWPPDAEQKQHSSSFAYPTCDNPCDDWFLGKACTPVLRTGAHGSSLGLNSSSHVQQLNPHASVPANRFLEPGEPAPTSTRKFLVFDQSGDQTSLMYSSVAIPYQFLNPPILPTSNVNYECGSNSHVCKDEEEMHEDTEEIDALLYSESEHAYDSDEASTGHSPLVLEEEEEGVIPSFIPAKRRRLEFPELDPSLMDTASSANVVNRHSLLGNSNDAELSYVDGYSKRERIRTTMDVLRRIVPGGESKDAAALLDEAIHYLKSLRLQAKSFDPTAVSL